MARPRNEERALIAQRRTRVLAMRIEERTYAEIAAELGISESVAQQDYRRAIEQCRGELAATVAQARTLELARLAAMEREVWAVLRRRHLVVSNGRVVRRFVGVERDEDGIERLDPDGKVIPVFEELEDDAPILQAVDRLERISARRARLLGLDAPVKVEVSDEVDAEITRLAAELAAGVGNLDAPREAEAAGDPAAG